MSKNNENKLVPRLRFPEFTNENWNRKTIDETCEILNNLRKPLTTNLREKGIYPYYGASGIIDYVKDYIFNERLLLIGEDGAKWLAYEKTAFIAEGKYWVNNHAHVLKPIGVVDTLLENYLVKLDISPFITGAAPPKLTLGKLKSIPVPIPENQKEQQKIAACLSSLDDVITAESKKLEVLKEHKKGLLQNLFPQEGETVPKLRFKEFENSGEWVEYPINSIGEVVTGGTPSKEENEYWGGDFVWVTAQDFKGKYITDSVLKLTQKGKEKSRIIPKNSVLVTCIASIGLNGINKVECATNQQINSVVCNSENHYEFVYYSITKNGNRLKNLAGQTAVPIINKSVFEKFIIHKPKSYQEQQKIAACLSSIDDLINAQSQKIETLKLHKKGLLQGLFPDVNEHNG